MIIVRLLKNAKRPFSV